MAFILQSVLLNIVFYFYNATPTGFTHTRQTFYKFRALRRVDDQNLTNA